MADIPMTDSQDAPEAKTKALEEKNAGNTAFQKGQFKQAIQHYSQAVNLDPFNILAAAYLRMGSFDDALADTEKAISLFSLQTHGSVDVSHGAKAYYRKGECLAGTGQYQQAIDAYTMGLEAEPTNKDITHARDAAQLALRHAEFITQMVGPNADRAALVRLRQAHDAVQHNLRVLRETTFAKDVTNMTQKLQNTLRCIQYVVVDANAKITSTNGSNTLQPQSVAAAQLADGKVIVCHLFVHVDTTTRQQEYLIESGEVSNRFKSKPWNSFQQAVMLITAREASSVGVFNEHISKLLFK